MIQTALAVSLAVALIAPQHATSAKLDACDKSHNLAVCHEAVDYYFDTYQRAAKRQDGDEECQDMLYGAATYLELTVVDVHKGLDYSRDAHDSVVLFDAVGNNCPDRYSQIVVKIDAAAQSWKDGDIPLETQAVEIIEGRSVQSASR